MSHTFSVFTVHVTPFLASYREYFHHLYIYLWKKTIYNILPFNNDVSPFFASLAFLLRPLQEALVDSPTLGGVI